MNKENDKFLSFSIQSVNVIRFSKPDIVIRIFVDSPLDTPDIVFNISVQYK